MSRCLAPAWSAYRRPAPAGARPQRDSGGPERRRRQRDQLRQCGADRALVGVALHVPARPRHHSALRAEPLARTCAYHISALPDLRALSAPLFPGLLAGRHGPDRRRSPAPDRAFADRTRGADGGCGRNQPVAQDRVDQGVSERRDSRDLGLRGGRTPARPTASRSNTLDPAALAAREPHLEEGLSGALHFYDTGAVSDPGGLGCGPMASCSTARRAFRPWRRPNARTKRHRLAGQHRGGDSFDARGRGGARSLVGPGVPAARLPHARCRSSAATICTSGRRAMPC